MHGLKAWGAAGILVVGWIAGVIPLRFRALKENKQLFAMANFFCSGVFIGIACLHLLPDALSNLEYYERVLPEPLNKIPLTFLTLAIGFITFTLIEGIQHKDRYTLLAMAAGTEEDTSSVCIIEVDPLQISTDEQSISDHQEPADDMVCSHSHLRGYPGVKEKILHDTWNTEQRDRDKQYSSIGNSPVCNEMDVTKQLLSESEHNNEHCTGQHRVMHHHHLTFPEKGITVAFFLMTMLSLHSVIAGIAVGVSEQQSTASELILAILLHKWIEAFALGTNMLSQHVSIRKATILVSVFSTMTPIGIGIGTLIKYTQGKGNLTQIIENEIMAFAAGMFLAVAMSHLDISHSSSWYCVLLIFMGILLMTAVTMLG